MKCEKWSKWNQENKSIIKHINNSYFRLSLAFCQFFFVKFSNIVCGSWPKLLIFIITKFIFFVYGTDSIKFTFDGLIFKSLVNSSFWPNERWSVLLLHPTWFPKPHLPGRNVSIYLRNGHTYSLFPYCQKQ